MASVLLSREAGSLPPVRRVARIVSAVVCALVVVCTGWPVVVAEAALSPPSYRLPRIFGRPPWTAPVPDLPPFPIVPRVEEWEPLDRAPTNPGMELPWMIARNSNTSLGLS